MNDTPARRKDGKYEEKLGETWVAEYAEDPVTGLWQVEIFKHDVPEWRDIGYTTLEEASQSAKDYYNQL